MRLWPFRHRAAEPSDDAKAALDQADRALADATDLAHRADRVAEQLAETRRRNHFGLAVAQSMRRA